jgi:P-type conjugative transfer protein TrbJ
MLKILAGRTTTASLIVMLGILAGFSSRAFAGTVAGFGGSTEITQLLNNVQLVMSYATQAEQLETQLKNLARQSDAVNTNPLGYINKLAATVEQGQALGLSSARIASKLELAYGADYSKNAPYSARDYETVMKTTNDSIRGAMRSVGVQQGEMESEADAILKLKSLSGSSEGNLQVQQTGNQIALEQVQQLQKLRAMNMAQSQAMNARMLAVQQQEAHQRAESDNFFGKTKKPMRTFNN